MENDGEWRGVYARLERLEDLVQNLDECLRGDRRKKIIGLLAAWDRHDDELRKLNAVVFGDATGYHGMYHDVDVLMERRTGKERRSEFLWKNWIPTLLALLAIGLTILTNWDQIRKLLPKDHPGPVEQMIEKAKHPKPKHRHYVIHETPSDPTTETQTETEPDSK